MLLECERKFTIHTEHVNFRIVTGLFEGPQDFRLEPTNELSRSFHTPEYPVVFHSILEEKFLAFQFLLLIHQTITSAEYPHQACSPSRLCRWEGEWIYASRRGIAEASEAFASPDLIERGIAGLTGVLAWPSTQPEGERGKASG